MSDKKVEEGYGCLCYASAILAIPLSIGIGGIFGWPYGFIALPAIVLVAVSTIALAYADKINEDGKK